MNQTASIDDVLWSSRCWFWQKEVNRGKRFRGRRERERQPLLLSGFGVSLRIEGGTLRIRNGFTHHPQEPEVYRFFKGDLHLPERILLLDCTGSISIDVMSWLSQQGVALVHLSWQGEVISLASPSAYSANLHRVEWQRRTRSHPAARMAFCTRLIADKISATLLILENDLPPSKALGSAIQIARATIERLDVNPPRDLNELRGIEGTMAGAYFRAWAAVPMRWRKRSQRHIPEDWTKVGSRSTDFFANGNRNARHPVNAILNYAYTVLESELQIWAVAEGYDPSIGIMHESRAETHAFIFDVMEPQRAPVDRAVLSLIREVEFDPADFAIRSDGVCRLNPALAKRVAQLITADRRRRIAVH